MVDTPLATFPFVATGAPTPRTMPDRLAEIKNVKDFGALGNGAHDDTSAIQAAIDWTAGANRGTIFFPQGTYFVSAPLTFNYNGNLSIAFVGVAGSVIVASPNFADYIFKRSLGTPNNTQGGRIFEKLNIQNGNAAGGCIQLGSTDGGVIRDCTFNGHVCITTEDSAGNSSKSITIETCVFATDGATGSHGVILGGNGVIKSCTAHSIDVGFRLYGSGFSAISNRIENCNTSILLGVDSANTDKGASGFSLEPNYFEGNGTAIDLVGTCSGFDIGGKAIGHDGSNGPVGGGASQYGLRIRAGKASAGQITLTTGSVFDVAGIAIANASSRANLVFMNCGADESGGAGVPWILPTNAYTAQFINCNTSPVWTYSQLPTGGNVLEGDEFNISDGTNGLSWGDVATNTGTHTTHYLVRYNGTNWTVVGK